MIIMITTDQEEQEWLILIKQTIHLEIRITMITTTTKENLKVNHMEECLKLTIDQIITINMKTTIDLKITIDLKQNQESKIHIA